MVVIIYILPSVNLYVTLLFAHEGVYFEYSAVGTYVGSTTVNAQDRLQIERLQLRCNCGRLSAGCVAVSKLVAATVLLLLCLGIAFRCCGRRNDNSGSSDDCTVGCEDILAAIIAFGHSCSFNDHGISSKPTIIAAVIPHRWARPFVNFGHSYFLMESYGPLPCCRYCCRRGGTNPTADVLVNASAVTPSYRLFFLFVPHPSSQSR